MASSAAGRDGGPSFAARWRGQQNEARVRTMATAPGQALLSVDEVISEALLFLRHEVQSHGLMLTHHTNPAAPKVLGDRSQLQQELVNLTVNAIQAMAQMGTTRRTGKDVAKIRRWWNTLASSACIH